MSSQMCLLLLLAGLALPARADALPDPTRPPSVAPARRAPAAAPEGPRLTSILVAPDRRLAIIDGRVVEVGDRVAGGRVLAIEPFAVRVGGRGAERTLHLSGRPVKQRIRSGARR